jgi:hypothetical protein
VSPGGKDLKRILAVLSFVGVTVLIGAYLPAVSHMVSRIPDGSDVSAQPSQINVREIKRTFRWEDINSAKIVKREGDRIVIDANTLLRKFRIDLAISESRLDAVVNSFGIPYSRLKFTYKDKADLERKQAELIAYAASRGIGYWQEERAFGPGYRWIVKNSRGDVGDAVDKLAAAGREAGYSHARAVLGLYATFVQTIPYKEQPVVRKARDGSEIFVSGVSMPLETLARNEGDCDTKCLLFASLLARANGPDIVFLRGGGHVFVGVETAPRPNDRYVKLRTKRYVLIELTNPWLIGHVPGETWRSLQLKKFEVIPLAGD